MIIRKTWNSKKTTDGIFKLPIYSYKGYFLFGIIPIYISRSNY